MNENQKFIFNNPYYRDLARNLRANGYKVMHFLHCLRDYAVQTSAEMKALADICDPSEGLIIVFEADKLDNYVGKLVRANYRIIIG